MGVIDHHQRLLDPTQTLHAPGRALQFGHHREDFVQRVIQCQQRTDHRQQVAQVKAPQQAAAQTAFALRGDDIGAHAAVIEVRRAAIQVGSGIVQAVADQPRRCAGGGQLTAQVVIQVKHSATQFRPAEQGTFRRGVGGHAAVVIEVVTGQVGEHCHVKIQRCHPALIQAMGRHFHRHGFGARAFQFRQQCLHADGIRGGMTTLHQLVMKATAEGADDATTLAQQLQCLSQQLADAGLAIGAGHANQAQGTARLAIKAPGNRGQLRGQAVHW